MGDTYVTRSVSRSFKNYSTYNARARGKFHGPKGADGVTVTPSVTPRAFIVPGRPAVKGSTVAFLDRRGRVVTKQDTKNGKAWAASVAWAARQAGLEKIPKGIGVIVSVEYAFAWPGRPTGRCHPCVRPDVDKLARALLDALTGVAYEDDGQVVALTVRKLYEADPVTRVWVARA